MPCVVVESGQGMDEDTQRASNAPDELLPRVAAGDAAAFAALFRRWRGHVYRFALHMTGSPALAEDVAQDVFLAVMDHAGRYEVGRSTEIAWLCGIARNLVRQRLDRPGSTVAQWPAASDEGSGPSTPAGSGVLDGLLRSERVAAVRAAVATLPMRYREVVVLCDLEEMSYQDAADALSCAVGTVRSRLSRGRALLAAKLRASLESHGAEDGRLLPRQKAPARVVI